MITRLIVLCCALIPLLCLAVAPQKAEKLSRVDLDFVPPQAISQLGQVSVAGDQFVINAMSDRKPARLNARTDPPENQRGSRAFLLLGLVHAIGKFLECAFWKLGLLDGAPGFIIAVNSAFYVFLKHAKAWEKGLPKDDNLLPPEQTLR